MVNKCSGFGCKSGYKSNKEAQSVGPRLTFHSFPINNKSLYDKWVKANPRSDFIPSKHSGLVPCISIQVILLRNKIVILLGIIKDP